MTVESTIESLAPVERRDSRQSTQPDQTASKAAKSDESAAKSSPHSSEQSSDETGATARDNSGLLTVDGKAVLVHAHPRPVPVEGKAMPENAKAPKKAEDTAPKIIDWAGKAHTIATLLGG